MAPTLAQQARNAAEAMQQGRFPAVLKIAKSVLKSAPDQAYFANLAGLACVQTGDTRAALGYFMAAIRADPAMIDARRNLAQALIGMGSPDKALTVLEKALALWPQDHGILYLRASACHASGDAQATVQATDAGLAAHGGSGALHNLRALAFDALGHDQQAQADFQAAVTLTSQDPEARRNFAQFLAHRGRHEDAMTQVAAGLEHHPTHPGLLLQKASLLLAAGDEGCAKETYATALAAHPDLPLALNGLAYLADSVEAKPLQDRIAKAMRGPVWSRELKVVLGFAVARLARVRGAADAERVLAAANAAAAKALPYDADADAREQDVLLAPFLRGVKASDPPTDMPAPIFITGLIRSGTTLAQQVLSAHPNVMGLGELTRARTLADAQAAAFSTHGTLPDAESFAADYRASLPQMPENTTHFVDKMPDNFRTIGYLLHAFPAATVIEMQRDPRDVALSMWDNFFPTRAHAYANDMAAMAAHMNLYARTMAQWRVLFPDCIQTVKYADLVQDIDAGARRMARLCNLTWHDAMAHPERNRTAVQTASLQQVREPVHTRSVGNWAARQDLLAPLIAGLDAALWPQIADT